jgi:hypothetical protein
MSPFGGAPVPQRTKAPPCMRWRSLARPSGRSPPIPRRPVARPAADCPATTGLDTRPRIRSPGSPAVSEVSPGSVSAFSGECVSTTWAEARTRLSADILRILWLSTGPGAVIPCVPALVHRFFHITVHRPRPGVGLHRQPGLRRRAARRGPDARLAAVTDRVLTDAVSALMRHNGYGDEAPPCMRWRGLARSHSPARRSLSCRLPDCCPLPTGPPTRTPAWNFGFPCSPRFPRSPPEFRGSPRIGIRVRW